MKKENFLAGQKILIAGGVQNSFYLLEYLLKEVGAEIIHKRTEEDTILFLLENPDVCLVLMDIKKPGMDELETTRKIRKYNTDVPIITQTALMLKDEKNIFLNAGSNDIILKLIDQDLLLQKIEHLLN